MKKSAWLGVVLLLGVITGTSSAAGLGLRDSLRSANRRLHGEVIDHTSNHGRDNRIFSPAMGHKRDLYVYLPPDFDLQKRYPLILWLHGFAQDEQSFLEHVVEPIDRAIHCGKLPPMIVAAPDGSLTGGTCLRQAGSFFINSKAGRYEDFVMQDVWDFVHQNYPIRPEPEAHGLAGISMGGGGAFTLAIKHRDRVKTVLAFYPPVNTRWIDCHGRYMSNFAPDCWGWRTDFSRRHDVVGRFYCVITIHLHHIIDALYELDSDVAAQVSIVNPIELIDSTNLKEGELGMYIAYGGKDQFNLDAQIESFLYRARERGLTVGVGYDPRGRHDAATATRLMPDMIKWLGQRMPGPIPAQTPK